MVEKHEFKFLLKYIRIDKSLEVNKFVKLIKFAN